MKIVWLEDDLKTIRNSVNYIKEKTAVTPVLCENFAEFSDVLEEIEDDAANIVIIDIRMLFNTEYGFSCFDKEFKVKQELDGGFEYFKKCIQEHFSNTKVLFFTSKPLDEAKRDAKKYDIDTSMIITKDNINLLVKIIKEQL
jgi:hypothetical protein